MLLPSTEAGPIIYLISLQSLKQPGDIPYPVRVATEGRPEIVKSYYRRAIEKWEIVIKQLPVSAEITPVAYTFAAESYERIGDPKKALEYFSIAAEQYPAYKHADYALFMVSRMWEQLQKQELATESQAWPMIVQASQTLLNRYPQSEYARIARKTVDSITATETQRKEQANEQQ
jgi:outer membrane protein assembly factor BamD (BamD/ComL family)